MPSSSILKKLHLTRLTPQNIGQSAVHPESAEITVDSLDNIDSMSYYNQPAHLAHPAQTNQPHTNDDQQVYPTLVSQQGSTQFPNQQQQLESQLYQSQYPQQMSLQQAGQQTQQFGLQQEADNNAINLSLLPSRSTVSKGKYALSDFAIMRTLGTGSFGRVHLVRSVHNGRYYAIKVLKKHQVVKMKQVEHTNDERRMLKLVEHPFLIRMWGHSRMLSTCLW